jgi:glucose/arabinose dehydrogenase
VSLVPHTLRPIISSLALTLLLATVIACGGDDDDDTNPTPSPTATRSQAPPLTPAATETANPPTAGPCGGPGGATLLPSDPGSTEVPASDAYTTTEIIGAGDSSGSAIEFALIPGQPDQAIVANQDGSIYRVSLSGAFPPQPWGDLSDRVTVGGEQGLLSVAFSLGFQTDCRVYAYYTPGNPSATVLSRFRATVDGLDPASEEVLLRVEEFAANHNGGHIAFDGSRYLYLSLGDGGGGGDPTESAQDRNRLLGKVLRLDVSGASGYSIPPDNPFSDGAGPLREEIFAYGFRNPWRMTIDPVTSEIWLGDVGQSAWEEVDRVVKGGNYGWDCFEGPEEFEPDGCPDGGFQPPRAVHDQGNGRQAVTGGVVYRGDDMPELYGWYVYGDFYSGELFALDTTSDSEPTRLFDSDLAIASFTLLPDGEVAIVTYSDGILRLAR